MNLPLWNVALATQSPGTWSGTLVLKMINIGRIALLHFGCYHLPEG